MYILISYFLYKDMEINDDMYKYILVDMKQNMVEGIKKRNYPMGYTGEISIYEQYMSEDNKSLYNDVVMKFMERHPHSHVLFELYPDILI